MRPRRPGRARPRALRRTELVLRSCEPESALAPGSSCGPAHRAGWLGDLTGCRWTRGRGERRFRCRGKADLPVRPPGLPRQPRGVAAPCSLASAPSRHTPSDTARPGAIGIRLLQRRGVSGHHTFHCRLQRGQKPVERERSSTLMGRRGSDRRGRWPAGGAGKRTSGAQRRIAATSSGGISASGARNTLIIRAPTPMPVCR